MSKSRFFSSVFLSIALLFFVSGCSGVGSGAENAASAALNPLTGGSTSTKISGKVMLSSSVMSKPSSNYMSYMSKVAAARKSGKSGVELFKVLADSSNGGKILSAAGVSLASGLQNATVELYDADRPQYNAPIAVATTDSAGNYSFDSLVNAEKNGNGYKNGDPLYPGKFTVIATKYDSTLKTTLVAVQAIVKKFEGTVLGNDLVAQDSDAIPSVTSMFGIKNNSDGSYGSTTMQLFQNAGIQITFSMAMKRASVKDAITLIDSSEKIVDCTFKMSPDLITATIYPKVNLSLNSVYTINIGGGRSLTPAKNVYDKPLASGVKGFFIAGELDRTPPTTVRKRPTRLEKANMPIITPIRIGADELLDINTIGIEATPSIGDRPFIKYIGKNEDAFDYKYIYEIVPSEHLKMGTTYTITVDGGTDMAGLPMDVLNFSFSTETVSAGVDGTDSATVSDQLAVKDVFGKWLNALNSRNSSLLTTYMSGDFYWMQNKMSGEDLNRDGRLSLNEFTAMLNNWFKQLDTCGSTVSGDVVGSIGITGSTANIAFSMTVTPTNTTDSSCKDNPPSTMYAVLEKINSAWIMTYGSEVPLTDTPPTINTITLNSPTKGTKLAEPTQTSPLTPSFQWTVPTLGATDLPITSYMVLLIDNRSRYHGTAWGAVVDGSSATPGSQLSVQFESGGGTPAKASNLVYLDPNGMRKLGFESPLSELKAGGDYSWAVLGFKTKLRDEFKVLNFDPTTYLVAASDASNFAVDGVWKELTVNVADGTRSLTYNESSGSYDAGSAGSVTITVNTPNAATNCYWSSYGYIYQFSSQNGNLDPVFTNGAATFTINLSNQRNWVSVSDGNGLYKQFAIFTTGGTPPKVAIDTITAKDCNNNIVSLTGPDSWGNYASPTVCYVDISGYVDPSITGTLSLWLNNDSGYYSNSSYTLSGATYSFTNIPVYNGRNWLGISGSDSSGNGNNNNIGVETMAGATFSKPLDVPTILGCTETPGRNMYESYWDCGANKSISIDVISTVGATSITYSHSADPNWNVGSGSVSASSPFTLVLLDGTSFPGLAKGWNYIYIYDNNYNGQRIYVYTKDGSTYSPPNKITSIDNIAVTPAGSYSTSSCSVTIDGTTINPGSLYVYLNNYNSATGKTVNEYQTIQTNPDGTYSIPQNVYYGSNSIDVYDSSWSWQGLQVNATSSSCAAIVFDITAIKDGGTSLSTDTYGDYNAVAASGVTLKGTAKSSKDITVYIYGEHYDMRSTTAALDNTFSVDIPIYNGYNYVYLTDGYSWVYKTVYTTGGAVWTPPINTVTVSLSNLTAGGGVSDTWANWNTNADTVTITGNGTLNGTGYWYLYGSGYDSNTFTTSSGTFTISGLQLYYGYNYIYLYDANWNSYYLTIYTTGGIGAPTKYVKITSPSHNDTVANGTVSVAGTIDPSFVPQTVYGYVYDYTTGQYSYFSSNSTDQLYGYLPVTVSNNSFTFNFTAVSGNATVIEVYAYDINWNSHGDMIYVNNSLGYGSYYWKPGSKPNQSALKAQAHKTEFLKRVKKSTGRK